MNTIMAQIANVSEANRVNNVSNLNINTTNTNSDFMKIFEDALNMVNEAENNSKESSSALLNKTIEDLHTVIIDAEKAQLTLGLAVQVRNKVIDAYNEVMRMQI